MNANVVITSDAQQDIHSAKAYLARQQPSLGNRFAIELLDTLDRIGSLPYSFAEIENGVRAVGVRKFNYIVYYQTDGTTVEVIAVLHGSRSSAAWQRRIQSE